MPRRSGVLVALLLACALAPVSRAGADVELGAAVGTVRGAEASWIVRTSEHAGTWYLAFAWIVDAASPEGPTMEETFGGVGKGTCAFMPQTGGTAYVCFAGVRERRLAPEEFQLDLAKGAATLQFRRGASTDSVTWTRGSAVPLPVNYATAQNGQGFTMVVGTAGAYWSAAGRGKVFGRGLGQKTGQASSDLFAVADAGALEFEDGGQGADRADRRVVIRGFIDA
ncbi:MAG: hypothetical protein ABR600_04215 [Actinomycetota bacterium]